MTGSDPAQATGGIERIIDGLQTSSPSSRRTFLRRSAAAGAGALALAIGSSNAALAHDATDDDVSDVDVLNYALTLEHLEYAFYRDMVDRFPRQAYRRSDTLRGFAAETRWDVPGYMVDIRDHEGTHVDVLSTVIDDLGGTPVAEAEYDFGVDTVDDFLAVAQVLENTGVSAYDGAINLIGRASLLQAGATIATVEARHAAYLNFLTDRSPFPDAFDDPKTMSEVLDAAGGFIVSGDE